MDIKEYSKFLQSEILDKRKNYIPDCINKDNWMKQKSVDFLNVFLKENFKNINGYDKITKFDHIKFPISKIIIGDDNKTLFGLYIRLDNMGNGKTDESNCFTPIETFEKFKECFIVKDKPDIYY